MEYGMDKKYNSAVLQLCNWNITRDELTKTRRNQIQERFRYSDEEYEELIIQYKFFKDEHIAWFEHIEENSRDYYEDDGEEYEDDEDY